MVAMERPACVVAPVGKGELNRFFQDPASLFTPRSEGQRAHLSRSYGITVRFFDQKLPG